MPFWMEVIFQWLVQLLYSNTHIGWILNYLSLYFLDTKSAYYRNIKKTLWFLDKCELMQKHPMKKSLEQKSL